MKLTFLLAGALLALTLLPGCGGNTASHSHAEAERGPHGGRMLRDGEFALEVTIFEDGVEPEYRVYPYRDGKPIAPREVRLSIALTRLGGKVDRFTFRPEADYLRGSGVVSEPHSFDVSVSATASGKAHGWRYASYEGRTTIATDAAKAGGIVTERAGPATIDDLVDMSGRIEITPEGKADVRARLPGQIMWLGGKLGDTVTKGQTMARVESSYSLRTYAVPAPISGIIVAKNANVGDVTGDRAIFTVADPTSLHAEFFVYPRDAERIAPGQKVVLRSLSGLARVEADVEAILPTADIASQTLLAHVHLPANAARLFRPGMGVEGAFTISSTPVPLAVKTKAIQRFRTFEVIYAKVGNTYEVRMLTIGRRTPEWTEVLGGLEPGTDYVTDGAFLVRADIEKSGAAHDH